ncbi:MAG: hypothetical protein JST55_11905 [Bacteroidetes bacterium]|nr:hypothetical protein [Bacteroidota bacterium]
MKKYLLRFYIITLLFIFAVNIFNVSMELTSGKFYQSGIMVALILIAYSVPVFLFVILPTIFSETNKSAQVVIYSFLSFLLILIIFFVSAEKIEFF